MGRGLLDALLHAIAYPAVAASQVQNVPAAVKAVLARQSSEDVCAALQAAIASPRAKELLRHVLASTRPDADMTPEEAQRWQELRSRLACAMVGWLAGLGDQEGGLVSDAVLCLAGELEHLQEADLKRVYGAALSALEEGRPHACALLELVPPCLALISSTSDGDSQQLAEMGLGTMGTQVGPCTPTGEASAAHRDAALHRLLHCTWRPEQVASVLGVLRDLRMSPEQLRALMGKAFKACRSAGLQLVPTIMYQLLQAGAVAEGGRTACLRGMAATFDHLEAQPQHQQPAGLGQGQPSTELLQVEATTLMHVATVLRYDSALGPDWLRHLKADGLTASSFQLQVVLAMCRVHRLERPLLALLPNAITQGLEADAQGAASGWLAGALPAAAPRSSGASMEQGLLKAIGSSRYASDLVAPALVALAAQLMSAHVDCPLHLVLGCQPQGRVPPQASAGVRSARLGLRLMEALFDVHSEARPEVLRVCQAQLAGGRLEASLPYVLLLGAIGRAQPQLLAEHTQRLKDCLQNFSVLSPEAAQALLAALWPLCQRVRALQDYVVMVLRKVMFARDVNSRLVAVRGFLFLIIQQLGAGPTPAARAAPRPAAAASQQGSSSQASLSQMAALGPEGAGLTLLQELLGFLRKALTQQAPVRAALYNGLLQVLEADPCARECLAALLQPHLARLLEEGADPRLPPLRLGLCVAVQGEEARLLEPLPALLACVRSLAQRRHPDLLAGGDEGPSGLGGAGEEGGECCEALQAAFDGLRRRLVHETTPGDFDLHAQTELNPGLPLGLANQLHVANLQGVLEVVMEQVVHECCSPAGPGGAPLALAQARRLGEELLHAFQMHQRLFRLATEFKVAAAKDKKKPAAGDHAPRASGQHGAGPSAGAKRQKPLPDFTPAEQRPPQLSPLCLARLCAAMSADGVMKIPADLGGSCTTQTCSDAGLDPAGTGADGAGGGALPGDPHTKLARLDEFRRFVLRSCANYLEAACQGAAAAAMMAGPGAAAEQPATQDWLLLAGPLFIAAQGTILSRPGAATATVTGGSGGTGGTGGRRGGGASGSEALGRGDSLEGLAARCLQRLLQMAEATQSWGRAMAALPLPAGAAVPPGGTAAAEEAAAGVAARLPLVRAMLQHLMRCGAFREAEVLAQCLLLAGRRGGEGGARAAGDAAVAACGQSEPHVGHLPLIKALATLRLRFAGEQDLAALMGLAQDVQRVVGDATKSTQEDLAARAVASAPPLAVPGSVPTAQAAAGVLLARLEEALRELEGAAAGARAVAGADGGDNGSRAAAAQRAELLRVLCVRCLALVQPLEVLANTILAAAPVVDLQVRVLTHAYKVLGLLAKLNTPTKGAGGGGGAAAAAGGDGAGAGQGAAAGAAAAAAAAAGPSKELSALVSYVHKSLTPVVYNFMHDTTTQDQDGGSAGGAGKKGNSLSRIKKEQRLLPNLVFAIEAWERQLVVASRAFKGRAVNLLRDAKRSTNRDFRIMGEGADAGAAAAGGRPPRGTQRGAAGTQRRAHHQHPAASEAGSAAAEDEEEEEVGGSEGEECGEEEGEEGEEGGDSEEERGRGGRGGRRGGAGRLVDDEAGYGEEEDEDEDVEEEEAEVEEAAGERYAPGGGRGKLGGRRVLGLSNRR